MRIELLVEMIGVIVQQNSDGSAERVMKNLRGDANFFDERFGNAVGGVSVI